MARSLNIDPGFAHMGWSVTKLPKSGNPNDVKLLAMGVIETKASDKKQRVLSADDSFRRAREIASALHLLIENWKPKVVCFEAASFPRNSSTAAKLGMGYGVIAAVIELVSERRGLPAISVSPQDLKRAVCGKASASKVEVTDACRFMLKRSDSSAIPWFEYNVPETHRNHGWDSLGALFASLDSDVIRAVTR